ncbi:MAG: hypothetical protein ACI9ES_002468 [Oceanospirillaceae bacterium]|jgi:hypothetical protein
MGILQTMLKKLGWLLANISGVDIHQTSIDTTTKLSLSLDLTGLINNVEKVDAT